jgi:hypothetical protein
MSEQSASPTDPHGKPPTSATPADIPAGTRVISWYDDQPVHYGGPGAADAPGPTLSTPPAPDRLPVRTCPPQRVAPADVVPPTTDSRVSVERRPRAEMPSGEPGEWRLTLPDSDPTWHRTKRDATATGLRRIAILDWHAGKMPRPVVLPHTGMTVPHTRLTLRKLRSMPTSDGEAYTAELLLDGKSVGTIENTGRGGATIWHPSDPARFSRQAMTAFIAACRDDQLQPMHEEFVLAELFEETRTARDIARYLKAGKVPVRTISAITDGAEVCSTFPDSYYGVPSGWGSKPDMLAAGMWRERPDAHAIQRWTGEGWESLPNPAAQENPR